MDKIDLLYDHYKDTCEFQRVNLELRNKLFVYVVLLLGLLILLVLRPDTIGGMIIAVIKEKFNFDMSSSFGIFQSLLWVLLLYASIRYYQATINIERTYKYIHSVEARIAKEANIQFNREGGDYLQNYPICSQLIDILYKWFFPLLYIIIVVIKIVSEKRCGFEYVFDCIVAAIAIILCALYMKFNYANYINYKDR